MASKKLTTEDRFWGQVEMGPESECWNWTGRKRLGYGRFTLRKKEIPAARFGWELTNGPIGGGVHLKKTCGNALCVNPAHQEPRTMHLRFWSRVDRDGGPLACWPWTGSTTGGYGNMSVNGKVECAHRISWEMKNGAIPDGLCVLHHCDNPPCVNPAHLFVGTRLDNARDRDRKGRRRINGPGIVLRGERHPNSKLTEAEVFAIRAAEEIEPKRVTAGRFGIARRTVSNIQRRATWRHI